MLTGGVGLARDMGRKDVGEEVAGLSGAGDPCPEGVTEMGARRLKSLSCVRNAP